VIPDSDDEAVPRRFLHCCYSCGDAKVVSEFFKVGFNFVEAWQSAKATRKVPLPGVEHVAVTKETRFVYDYRGPRVGPAIAVQGWDDPAPIGEPYREPHHVGIQALGVAVRDLDHTLDRLNRLGATLRGRADSSAAFGGPAAVARDPRGVTLDIVQTPLLGPNESQLVHVRITCANLGASRAWYTKFGFSVIEEQLDTRLPGSLFGRQQELEVAIARLRLPDEPFGLVLVEWKNPKSEGTPYDVAYHRGIVRTAVCIDDTRDYYQRHTDNGQPFDGPPIRAALKDAPVPDVWSTRARDPDGIGVGFVQRPREAFRERTHERPNGNEPLERLNQSKTDPDN
jgi:catechol 2,3-dioxygenase-like lactoylglutathione lyase family enzyme